MASIGRLWAGKIFGTNTGNVALEISGEDPALSGTIRFLDDSFGLVVYAMKGSFDGTALIATGEAVQAAPNIVNGTLEIKAALTPQGELRGEWTSTIGTGGTFHLFPHDAPARIENPSLPERMHTAVRTLGAIRLYADDVRELIGFLRRDFNPRLKVVVTYVQRGNEISRFGPDFEADIDRLGDLRYLKLSITEPDAYGVSRVASIELNANGANEVRTQGVQESWVVGKAEAISAELRRHQKTLTSGARRFGLNFNSVLGTVTLVLLPELTVVRRAIFIALIVLVSWTFSRLHARLVPNTLVHLTSKPTTFERAWPQMLSWIIAVTAGVVASIAYGVLKGDFPALFAGFFHP
jgi:hypothetical protein